MEWLRKLLAEYMGLVHCDFKLEDRESEIISKKFWFIQRLVERDRINFGGVRISAWYSLTDNIIMLVSIQENPLSFLNDLISYE